jgi:hypothetical protein
MIEGGSNDIEWACGNQVSETWDYTVVTGSAAARP